MDARNARSRALAIIGLVGVITFAAAGAHAAVTVNGDAGAWKEIHAAFKKLLALSAYRVKITSGGTTSTVIEVVRPNSYHSVSRTIIDTSVWTSEIINVNGQIRKRMTGVPGVPEEWRCSTGAPPIFGGDPFEATALNGTLDVSRGPDTDIGGAPVRTYQYLFTQSGQTMRTKESIYVDKANGLPRRIVNADASGDVTGTTDYYDYGAKIVLTLPPCK